MPDGFEAYARICHPVPAAAGHSVSWRQVAAVSGAVAHPLMQWHALVGEDSAYARDSSRWDGDVPALGHLDSDAFQRLVAVLEAHSTTPDDCVAGYWVGYTHATTFTQTFTWTGQASSSARGADGPAAAPQVAPAAPAAPLAPAAPAAPARLPTSGSAVAPQQLVGTVHHPGRDYELYTGPLSRTVGRSWSRQSPHLLWPADQTWCVATEIDFDSTLVGGDHALISHLLCTRGLDAWPVQPTDSLQAGSDTINQGLRPPHDHGPSR